MEDSPSGARRRRALKWIANGGFYGIASRPSTRTRHGAITRCRLGPRGALAVAAVRHNDVGLDTVTVVQLARTDGHALP